MRHVPLCLVILAMVFSACAPPSASPTVAPGQAAPGQPQSSAPATAPPKQASGSSAATAPARPAATQPTAQPAPSKAQEPAASPASQAPFDEQAVASFYRGKTVRMVVGYGPGGGYDTYSRVIARHLGRHIPGTPTVIVENMPGAGSLVAMNQVYNSLPKDGTIIGNVNGSLALHQALGGEGVEYDMARVPFVGVPAPSLQLMLVHRRAGITSPAQVLGPDAREIVVGMTAPGSTSYNDWALLTGVLDARLKGVPGYDGTAKVQLAMEQGELDGGFNSWESVKISDLDKVKSGELTVPVKLTDQPIPGLASAPGIFEFTQTEEQRQLFRFGTMVPNEISKVYLVAPDVPPDRVRALQAAFAKTMADKEFLADAEQAKLDIQPVDGEKVRESVSIMMAMSADIKARLKKLLLPEEGSSS